MPLSVVLSSRKRFRIEIRGIVQGVGFRPFVYQLAHEFSLKGFVFNGGDGVIIEVEGAEAQINKFSKKLQDNSPPLSRIDSFMKVELECQGEEDFIIRLSNHHSIAKTMVSADVAMCSACEQEFNDPSNRRFSYPFINCTDCGPRYTIIRSLPYDRANTSMAKFGMCSACATEYKDPFNRRYHAQPISCYDCGPKLSLLNAQGNTYAKDEEAIRKACTLIEQGHTIAIKGLGGFHLVCDATNDKAVESLRQKKNRPTKPLAVMFPDMKSIIKNCKIGPKDKHLILSYERPIVIVDKNADKSLASSIAPGIDRVGVFLPYTPLHYRILGILNRPLVATSANMSDEPIIIDDDRLLKKISSLVHSVLTHDREIVNACDDSVIMSTGEKSLLLRMARGYAPRSMPLLQKTQKKILAVGAHQKSALALAFEDHIILSAHIGDLNSIEAFEYFKSSLKTFNHFYDFEPEIIVCDKHPGYETTKWAQKAAEKNIGLIMVQHHYAHALACMAEHNLNEKVLAFCFDGTGYGDDGTLWGGEVLIADPMEYQRIKHIRPFRLLGGEKAVKEPRRIGLSLLFECFDLDEVLALNNPVLDSFTVQEIKSMHIMWTKGINSPLCSSVGRLFDGVAALGGIAQKIGYEGESGLLLESITKDVPESFSFEIDEEEIDIREMIKEIAMLSSAEEVASRFMTSLCKIILEVSEKYKDLPIVMSGGVFQNRFLVKKMGQYFSQENRTYYIQERTPVNDGSIALGQVYHALHILKEKR